MLIIHLIMIGAGIGAIVWGFPAAHRLRSPWDVAGALLVLAGVILALLGILLAAVPGFFRG
jgi:hypothetical protein